VRRREFVFSGVAIVVGGVVSACGDDGATQNPSSSGLAARFAQFSAAEEPNAELSKIVWPSFVSAAKPEIRTLYEFQLTHGELMRYIPCYCGCGRTAGHKNNRDCYVQKVNPDGSAVLDSMAPT
jgi:hypothetical protein